MQNRVTDHFDIEVPIIQAGMVWCSGWKLASAVSDAGGLGLIGSGSMRPDTLLEHIRKCKEATGKPFGVNLPLIYPHSEDHVDLIIKEKVPVVFTSAGNPKKYTSVLKAEGIKVVHVVSSLRFALKAEEAGADAVVAEGFEAGGHNGREETTTFCLVPMIAESLKIPVIAAGGIASGRSMLAAFALGAEAVQVGSAFAVAEESSAHVLFKKRVTDAGEGETVLSLKELAPVRLLKNEFYNKVRKAYEEGATVDQLKELLGKGRSRKGIFEGDLNEGELEIGQVSAMLKEVNLAADILHTIWNDFQAEKEKICKL